MEQMKTNRITEGIIWKQLFVFFFPIMLGTFFQQLYNTIDALVVGQVLGEKALSAVGGSSSSIINMLIGFFVGVSTGATVLISQYFGAKNEKEVKNAIGVAVKLAIVGGILFMTLCLISSQRLLILMKTPEDTMRDSLIFLRISAIGFIPSFLYNMGSGILRAMGDSKRPLIFLMVSCLLNIVLDILLVVILKQGVAGAAIATLLAQCVSALLVLYILRYKIGSYNIGRKNISFHKYLLIPMLTIGLPGGIQSMMYAFSNLIIQSDMNQFGTATVAAWVSYSKIDGIYWMISSAIGIALTTFTGQNYGAGKIERIKKGTKICFWAAGLFSFIMGSLVTIFGKSLLGIFSNDAAVIAIGVRMIRIISPMYFTYVCIEILSGVCRGCGKVVIPTAISMIGVCGLRIAWLMSVIPLHHTIEMICYVYPLTWTITSIAFVFYYKKGNIFLRTQIPIDLV